VDSSEYRKRIAQQLTKAKKQRARQRVSDDKAVSVAKRLAALPPALRDPDDVAKGAAILQDGSEHPSLRETVLQRMGSAIGKSEPLIDLVLGLFRNPAEPVRVRLAALRVLQQASFASALFRSKRAEYFAALREVVNDEHAELREEALEILALDKDEYAQRRLLDGLKAPAAAIVPPEKAIQMLGYDIHAEHYPILRELVQNPPNSAAKKEAVRLLAADPDSKDLLVGMLTDKAENADIRQLSAAALRTMAPAEFTEHAKQIIVDDDEADDVRAASLTALINSGDQQKLRGDAAFTRKVERLRERSGGTAARSAAQFLKEQRKRGKGRDA
jgi:hypothetical protein